MKDMAIARLDATYLNQNQDIKDEIIASMVEKVVPVDRSPALYVISQTILGTTEEQLHVMARRRVRFRAGPQNPAHLFVSKKWNCFMDENAPDGRVRAHRMEFTTD